MVNLPSEESHTHIHNEVGPYILTRVDLALSSLASEPLWPAPERLEIDQAVVYGYSGKVTLLTKITPPALLSLDLL